MQLGVLNADHDLVGTAVGAALGVAVVLQMACSLPGWSRALQVGVDAEQDVEMADRRMHDSPSINGFAACPLLATGIAY